MMRPLLLAGLCATAAALAPPGAPRTLKTRRQAAVAEPDAKAKVSSANAKRQVGNDAFLNKDLRARARGGTGVVNDAKLKIGIVGAGLAGVQLAHFMEDAGRSYVLLERGEAAGSFFRKFPRHRNLISINKRHTGRGGSELAREHNLRHDWHSLLSGLQSGDVDEELLFANLMNENRFYPKADVLAAYADKPPMT